MSARPYDEAIIESREKFDAWLFENLCFHRPDWSRAAVREMTDTMARAIPDRPSARKLFLEAYDEGSRQIISGQERRV